MSEDLNHKDIFGLDELLTRFKDGSDKTDLDDFEKEALEGFEQFEDKEKVKEFVNTTHTRLNKRFEKQRKKEIKRLPTYWLAAAGIILIAALSVVFYSSLQEQTTTEQIALNEANENKKQIEPLQEEKTAEAERAFVAITPSKAEFKSREIEKTGHAVSLEPEKANRRTSELRANETPKVVAPVSSNEGLAATESDKSLEEASALKKELAATASKQGENQQLDANDALVKTEFPTKEKEAEAKSDYSKKESDLKQAAPAAGANTINSGSTAATTYTAVKNYELVTTKDESPNSSREERVTTPSKKTREKRISSASGASVEYAYFANGSKALNEAIKKRFANNEQLKTLDTKLNLILFISAEGKVSSVKTVDLIDKALMVIIEKEIKLVEGAFIPQYLSGKPVDGSFVHEYTP
jgi:hypothetical protein